MVSHQEEDFGDGLCGRWGIFKLLLRDRQMSNKQRRQDGVLRKRYNHNKGNVI